MTMSLAGFAGLIISLLLVQVSSVSSQRVCACYYTNWSQYRSSYAKFVPSNIDPFLCTHLLYAFGQLNANTRTLGTTEWNDAARYQEIMALKTQNPNLKILLAIGGYSFGTSTFDAISASEVTINQAATNSISFLRDNGFDGLDVDWEFPTVQTSSRFNNFLKGFRKAFDDEATRTGRKRLELTIAVSADTNLVSTVYQPSDISKYVDFINIMGYDFFGPWLTRLAHHSPLYVRQEDKNDPNLGRFSGNEAVQAWLRFGAPPNKLVLGMPTYARTARLSSANQYRIGDTYTRQTASGGRLTNNPGFLAYYEVCEKLAQGWTRGYISDSKVPFMYSTASLEWACHEDPESIKAKAQYIVDMGLAGAMVWTLDFDDFSGSGCYAGRYPLISKIKEIFDKNTQTGTAYVPPIAATTRPPPFIWTAAPPTIRTPASSGQGVTCRAGDYFIRDAYDCSIFYRCFNLRLSRFNCPTGLVFNTGGYCDYPRNVPECVQRIG